jgi:hypothetical protein
VSSWARRLRPLHVGAAVGPARGVRATPLKQYCFPLSYTVVLYTFLSQHTALHTIISSQSKIIRRRGNSKQLTGAWTRARSTAAASLLTPAPAPWHQHRSSTSRCRGLGYGLPVSGQTSVFFGDFLQSVLLLSASLGLNFLGRALSRPQVGARRRNPLSSREDAQRLESHARRPWPRMLKSSRRTLYSILHIFISGFSTKYTMQRLNDFNVYA